MLSLIFSIIITIGVMIQQSAADANLVFDSDGYNHGVYGPDPHQYYHSDDVVSPLLLVNKWEGNRTDDAAYIFLTLNNPVELGHAGPVIYRADDLSLVYSNPSWSAAHDAHIGEFHGDNYLVFIGQNRVGKNLSTNCLLYDSTYKLAYNISSHNQPHASMGIHECQLTTVGSVVVVLTEIVSFNLTAAGGPADGQILDNIVQEIDVETGKLLWMWRASEHYKLSDSYMEYKHGTKVYDYVHINSVERTSQGNFLISARHAHSIILVDGGTGAIIWALGGRNNNFTDLSTAGNATDFAWQHHARFHDVGVARNNNNAQQLTLFDNHDVTSAIGCAANCSRGKHVEIDYEDHTVRLISESYHPQSLVSGFEGSYQTLRNSGNVFLGWGANPTFTEHTASGDCVLDVQFDAWRPDTGYPVNYRAFRMDWKAYPTWDPKIAVVVRDGKDVNHSTFNVYVSWNGATEVAEWQLFVGNSSDGATEPAVVAPRAGFETEISLKSDLPFVRAAALDKDGQVLGTTAMVPLMSGAETGQIP